MVWKYHELKYYNLTQFLDRRNPPKDVWQYCGTGTSRTTLCQEHWAKRTQCKACYSATWFLLSGLVDALGCGGLVWHTWRRDNSLPWATCYCFSIAGRQVTFIVPPSYDWKSLFMRRHRCYHPYGTDIFWHGFSSIIRRSHWRCSISCYTKLFCLSTEVQRQENREMARKLSRLAGCCLVVSSSGWFWYWKGSGIAWSNAEW